MTQEALKLALEALKWCHGGEPCGTAEAIAVVEKALAQPDTDMRYTIALQRAIEWHCDGKTVPLSVAQSCPYHAEKLNQALAQEQEPVCPDCNRDGCA